MKEWFSKLTVREKHMVQVALVVVTFLFVYMVVIEPIASSYSKNKTNVEKAHETIVWMNAAAQEIKQLQGNKNIGAAVRDKQSILTLVDSSARKAGLAKVMKRVQPESDTGVRIWFENVEFDALIMWLAELESGQGLSVNEINVEQSESIGLVNVRVFLN